MLGAVGGLGGAASPATGLPVPQRPPTSTGIHSIRIDIPRTGQMFSFTKVLNVSDEPLSVQMSVMKLKAFQVIRSACQLAFFLTGLFIAWREWTRVPRRTFRLTVGTAFVIGAVCALGLSLRALHFWFIAGFPLALGIAFVWALMKFWPRSAKQSVSNPIISESPLPPDPTDTLWDISKKVAGLTVEKIKSLNNLKSNNLQPGQKLIVWISTLSCDETLPTEL